MAKNVKARKLPGGVADIPELFRRVKEALRPIDGWSSDEVISARAALRQIAEAWPGTPTLDFRIRDGDCLIYCYAERRATLKALDARK